MSEVKMLDVEEEFSAKSLTNLARYSLALTEWNGPLPPFVRSRRHHVSVFEEKKEMMEASLPKLDPSSTRNACRNFPIRTILNLDF